MCIRDRRGDDEHEASLHHGRQRVNDVVVAVSGGGHDRQRVNDVVVAVSGVVTAGKGLMMRVLAVSGRGHGRQRVKDVFVAVSVGGDQHEASQHYRRQRVNYVVVAVSGVVTAGKGLMMRLLAVSGRGDEHEASQHHGEGRGHAGPCCQVPIQSR